MSTEGNLILTESVNILGAITKLLRFVKIITLTFSEEDKHFKFNFTERQDT